MRDDNYSGPACHCGDPATRCCDNCDTWFCAEHGQRGGDRQVQDVGAVAYPSLCDKCLTDKI